MNPNRFFERARRFGIGHRVAGTILLLHLLSTVFESVGLAMIVPILDFIRGGGDIGALAATSLLWQRLTAAYGYLGIDITLPALLLTSFLSIVSRQVFVYVRVLYNAGIKESLIFGGRNRAFRKYLAARADYHDRHAVGDIVNDFTTELSKSVSALLSVITLAGYLLLTAVYVAVLFALSVTMTLAAFGVILLSATTLRRLFRKTAVTGRLITVANQGINRFLVERLNSARLIRLSSMEEAESAAMTNLSAQLRDNSLRLAALTARIDLMIEPLVFGFALTLLYVGISAFSLDLVEIGLFAVILIRLVPVIKEIMKVRQSILGSLGSIEAVEKRISELDAARQSLGGSAQFLALREGIRFVGVRFGYRTDSSVKALDGIDLTIPAGRITALVGPSGAGKSTLVDLLPRLRDPDAGSILFDGRPITEFSITNLRHGIAYAPQSPQIFNVTAVEHIRYGQEEALMDDVRKATRLAGADDFITALPEGYDTLLGERGSRLSGGQRQRLDLARALVGGAPVLILDEPTSELDADAEELFRRALIRIRAQTETTIVIIGHRLSSVRVADQIAVLQHGKVADVGSHDELIAGGGWYAQAVRKQIEPDATKAFESSATAVIGAS